MGQITLWWVSKMLAVILLLLVSGNSAISHWYESQHNKNGQYCCNEADGHDFFGSYTVNPDGSVELDDSGVHYKLPAYMVLDGANPTGHAVWWYYDETVTKRRQSYCFALGPGI